MIQAPYDEAKKPESIGSYAWIAPKHKLPKLGQPTNSPKKKTTLKVQEKTTIFVHQELSAAEVWGSWAALELFIRGTV